MPLVLAGATSGSTTISATDAVTVSLTLPNASGTLAVSGGSPSFTTITTTNDASISGLTVGKGGGSLSGNTVFGSGAQAATNTGNYNSAFGLSALAANTSGGYNSAFGSGALQVNTSGANNSGFGLNSLAANTTGGNNTAFGMQALQANTTASNNTAVGYQAGYSNTTTQQNVFVGGQAGYNNIQNNNVFVGYQAAYSKTTGGSNVALGYAALYTNSTGGSNTALGYLALQANTTASNNTAVGYQAGYSNTTGTQNTVLGRAAGYSNTSNSNSTLIGDYAGNATTGGFNTFVGSGSGYLVTTGAKNTIVGCYNGNQGGLDIRTASNYIVLSDGDGNPRQVIDGSGNVAIGATSAAGKLYVLSSANQWPLYSENNSASLATGLLALVASRNTTNATFKAIVYYNSGAGADKFAVYDSGNVVNTNGSYGAISDIKLKENIVDATPKLEDLCKVKVRQYNLKSDPDHKQIGVVAQELEEVFAGLVEESKDTDKDGNELGTTTKTVKYSVFVPMLIKAVQEQQALITNLTARLTALEGNK